MHDMHDIATSRLHNGIPTDGLGVSVISRTRMNYRENKSLKNESFNH